MSQAVIISSSMALPCGSRRTTRSRHHVPATHAATVIARATTNGGGQGAVCNGSSSRLKLVLGIESSCDDTGAAVVRSDGVVLGEALATQADVHAQWGGVVPNLAMEAHKAAIHTVVDAALRQAGIQAQQLDAVAVTVGPGLSMCLRVGAVKALQLSSAYKLPLIRVHHMEAHALVARMLPVDSMQQGGTDDGQRPAFPFLCLLVSGGHNLLVLVQGVGRYVQLGTTLDDALGEAYDKVARLLGLELKPSGGAALEALARHGNPHAFKFAVPMRKYANCDFSFAGLKTSARLAIEAHLGKQEPHAVNADSSSQVSRSDMTSADSSSHEDRQKVKADIAASFQHVATQHLVERVSRAVSWARESEPEVRHIVVAGGVACNQHIRAQLTQVANEAGLTLVLPPPKWCTDNGAMVAWAGIERMQEGFMEPPAQMPTAAQQPIAAHAPQPGLASGMQEVATQAAVPSSQGTAVQVSATGAEDDMWVDLRPRWPLTSTKHPRCNSTAATVDPKKQNTKTVALAAAQYGMRSARKARIHTSLTDMTMQELASKAANVVQQ